MDEEVIKDIGRSVTDMVFIHVSATDLSKFNAALVDSSASIKKSSQQIDEVIRYINELDRSASYTEDVNSLQTDTLTAVRETSTKAGISLLGLVGNLAGFLTFFGLMFSDEIRAAVVPFLEDIMTNLGIGTDLLDTMAPIFKVATGLLAGFFAYRSMKRILDIIMVVGKLAELIGVAASLVDAEKSQIEVDRKKGTAANKEIRKKKKEIKKLKKDLKSKNWFKRTYARFKLALPIIKVLGKGLLKIVGAATGIGLIAMTIYEVYDLVNELMTEYKESKAEERELEDDLAPSTELPELDDSEKSMLSKYLGVNVIFDSKGRAVSIKEDPEPPKPKPVEVPSQRIEDRVNQVSGIVSEASEVVMEAKKKALTIAPMAVILKKNNTIVMEQGDTSFMGGNAPYSTSIGR